MEEKQPKGRKKRRVRREDRLDPIMDLVGQYEDRPQHHEWRKRKNGVVESGNGNGIDTKNTSLVSSA